MTFLALLALASMGMTAFLLIRENSRLKSVLDPLSKQLEETTRLLASKDAITYGELSYAKQRDSQIAAYESSTRYYTGDELAMQDAKISGEINDDIEMDEEDLNAITAVLG
jgi:hypothetical protein